MAYPMIQSPTFIEFCNRMVNEFGCTYEQLSESIIVNDDELKAVHYLKRVIDGVPFTYTLFLGDDERVMPALIRSVCEHLQIDPRSFGLTLG